MTAVLIAIGVVIAFVLGVVLIGLLEKPEAQEEFTQNPLPTDFVVHQTQQDRSDFASYRAWWEGRDEVQARR